MTKLQIWHSAEETHRDGVFEEGRAVGWQERGPPQLPPGVIQVCVFIGLPQDSIYSHMISHVTMQETQYQKETQRRNETQCCKVTQCRNSDTVQHFAAPGKVAKCKEVLSCQKQVVPMAWSRHCHGVTTTFSKQLRNKKAEPCGSYSCSL